MSHEAYELAALTMRYVFTALMLLIVWRACRGALIDSRRAAKLRQLSPMTGVCGELVALEADERLRRGMRFPVIREGAIGSARRSDVRIRHSSVRRRHAFFQLADDGLHVRSHAGARLRDGDGRLVRELVLTDGGELTVGRVRLLLVLSVPDAPRRAYTHHEDERKPARRSDDDFVFPDDAEYDFPDDGRGTARRSGDGDFSFPGDERGPDGSSGDGRRAARRPGDGASSNDMRGTARRSGDVSGDARRAVRRTVDGDFSFPGDGDYPGDFSDAARKTVRRPGDERRTAHKSGDVSGAGRRQADDFGADPDDLFDVGDDSF